jgi:hypothetical protein
VYFSIVQILLTGHELNSFLLIGNFLIVLDFAFDFFTKRQCQRQSLLPGAQGIFGCLEQKLLLPRILGEQRGWQLVDALPLSLLGAKFVVIMLGTLQ